MVLEDHKRKGKTFIPPLLADGVPLRETFWHMERLPEIFWIAVIIERLGLEVALERVFELTQAIQATISRLRESDKVVRPYLTSSHMDFSRVEREAILDEHREADWLKTLNALIADLVVVWPQFPLAYLAVTESSAELDVLVKEVKKQIGCCLDRHDELALHVQAIVVATELRAGNTKLPKGLGIPDLNALFEYPESEESQHAAGFVVTSCNSIVSGPPNTGEDGDASWPRTFWNRCYKLDSCEYE